MKQMSQLNSKPQNEFENSNHVAKKKRAIATEFKKKNHKDIVDLINDEDDAVSEMYARFIR